MLRIVVAEDSKTVRRLLVEILEADPEITVVGEAANGIEAVERVVELAPDLVVMDINMPEMDGLEATRRIMTRAPTPILVVSAAANQRQLSLSLSATQAGALHVLPKPEPPRAERFAEQREQLIAMAKAMARVKVVRHWARRSSADAPAPIPRASNARRCADRTRRDGRLDRWAGRAAGRPQRPPRQLRRADPRRPSTLRVDSPRASANGSGERPA